MIKGRVKATFAGAAMLTMLAGGSAACAATCAASCNDQHTQCTRSGKDYAACMDAWRQCKAACTTPVKTSQAPAPQPRTMAAVARR